MGAAYTGDEIDHAHGFERGSSWAAHNWGWVLGFGVTAIGFGVALISSAFAGLGLLAWLAGLFLVFMGVAELVMPLKSGGRSTQLTGAAIAIIGGLILLAWPGETLTVLAYVVGIAFTAWGLASIVTALRRRRESLRWDVVVGIGAATLGILMMAWPTQTVALVGVLVGLVAIIWGVVTGLHALDLRRIGRNWEEVRRLERERIELMWEEFERAEETGQASATGRPAVVELSEAIEPPGEQRAA